MDDIQMELFKRKEKFFNAIRFILMKNAKTIETPRSSNVFRNKPRMQIPRPGAKWKYPNGRRNVEEVDKKELAFSTSNLMGKLYGNGNDNSNQLGHNGEEPGNMSSFLNEEKPGRFLNYVKNCLLNPEAEGNDGIQQKDKEHEKKAVKITRYNIIF